MALRIYNMILSFKTVQNLRDQLRQGRENMHDIGNSPEAPSLRYHIHHFQDEDRMYTTYGFRAKTRVNREDFGMTTNLGIENGGFMVGKHAYLTIDVEGDLADG